MKIETTPQADALHVAVYGDDGVGKTSFAADAPGAVFIDLEDGTRYLRNAQRVSPPDAGWTLDGVIEAVGMLSEADACQTIVLDSLDALERIIHLEICKRDKKANVEAYGYGKGYVVAMNEWRKLYAALDRVSKNTILICHHKIGNFSDPAGQDWTRYELSIHKHAAQMVRQLADYVLFAAYKQGTITVNEKVKGIDGETRVLRTRRCAAWDAKSRKTLPAELDLSWQAFVDAVNDDSTDATRAWIEANAGKVDNEAIHKWVKSDLATASAEQVMKAANKLRGMLPQEDSDNA